MTLNFMQKFPNGTPTKFVEKITKGLIDTNSNVSIFDLNSIFINCPFENVKDRYRRLMYNDNSRELWQSIPHAKIHTIRSGDRWKAGTNIHFKIWSGKPYVDKTFNFAPLIPCVSVQNIEITWSKTNCFGGCVKVVIDGLDVTTNVDLIDKLAINDGFDNRTDFFNWFNEDFKGQIIHWTNLKY